MPARPPLLALPTLCGGTAADVGVVVCVCVTGTRCGAWCCWVYMRAWMLVLAWQHPSCASPVSPSPPTSPLYPLPLLWLPHHHSIPPPSFMEVYHPLCQLPAVPTSHFLPHVRVRTGRTVALGRLFVCFSLCVCVCHLSPLDQYVFSLAALREVQLLAFVNGMPHAPLKTKDDARIMEKSTHFIHASAICQPHNNKNTT
jgi:hypothetical protein